MAGEVYLGLIGAGPPRLLLARLVVGVIIARCPATFSDECGTAGLLNVRQRNHAGRLTNQLALAHLDRRRQRL